MARKIAVSKRLVLLLLKNYGRPMERRRIHYHVHSLAQKLNLDLKFHSKYPYSPALDQELDEMIDSGVLKRLYVVGPRFTELYREYISLTDRGRKLTDELSDPPLEEAVREYVTKLSAGQGGQSG